LPQAAATLQSAVQMQPGKALYRNNLATVLVEMGRRQEALTQLQAVHPPAVANYNLGYLLERRGESANAITCYQTALAMDPGMTAAQTALFKLDASPLTETAMVASGPAISYQQAVPSGQSAINTATRPSPPVARPLPPVQSY
jgi:Tfp pilus assembly protein PilF